jgi:hypothetical protein
LYGDALEGGHGAPFDDELAGEFVGGEAFEIVENL